MEEKKELKIKFSTFLLIIALIIIIVLAFLIYFNKTNSNKQIADLEANTSAMQNTINDLENQINSENTNVISDVNTSTSNNFSEVKIKQSLQNYLDLVGSLCGSPENLLLKLGLLKHEDSDNQSYTDDYSIKTNIQYADYKEAMLNYVSEDFFNSKFTDFFKNKNGLLYYFNVGASGMGFDVDSITKKEDGSNSEYTAKIYIINPDDSEEAKNIEFGISNYDNNCVITHCDY